MKKKSKSFWVFTAVVAVVVGYALYDYKSGQSLEKEKATKSLLVTIPGDQIQNVSIHNKNAEIELQKDKDGWKMLKPVQDNADQPAVEQFIEGLVTERSIETAVEGDKLELASFGLDQPKGTIVVTGNSGQKNEFRIGSLKNFQGDAFLIKDQEKKVQIASSTWFSKVDKQPVDYRDKRLMRLSNAKAEKISIERGKEKFQLLKKENGWSSSSHPEWKLDQNKVRELLAMLNATSVLEFIAEGNAKPEELQKWGLKQPRFKLKVDIKDSPSWSADFAAGNDKVHRVHVNPPDFVLKLSPTDSDKFYQMTEDSFRDRSEPFNFDKTQVNEIQIRLGQNSTTLKSSDDKAHTLLSQLSNLKVDRFESGKSPKLTEEIVLKGAKGDILHLQWGSLHDGAYFAKSSLYPQVFTVLEADISNMKLDELMKKESVK